MKKIFHIDPEKCTGCSICEMICSFEHERTFNPHQSRVKIVKEEELGIDLPVFCLHCEDPVCVDVCPMGAIKKEGEGIIKLHQDACRGCKACMLACPYGAIRYVEGKMIKCDLCLGDPKCAQWCPTGAIRFIRSDSSEVTRSKKMVEILIKSVLEGR